MKYYLLFIVSFIITFCSCESNTQFQEQNKRVVRTYTQDSESIFELHFEKGRSHNNPTFVVWIESIDGLIKETLYITKSYATSSYGHAYLGNGKWSTIGGHGNDKAALPYWQHRFAMRDDDFVNKNDDVIDAITTATPKSSFSLMSSSKKGISSFNIYVEVNQYSDMNLYWTNTRFPENWAYKSSAQPAIVYKGVINPGLGFIKTKLEPIGHSDPAGDSGELYTDLSTITTALNIYKKITVNYFVKTEE